MRLFLFIFFTISISLFPENLIYNSNKSGMTLEPIDDRSVGEYHIEEIVDDLNWTKTLNFYQSKKLLKKTEEEYTSNFLMLERRTIFDGINKTIEIYNDSGIDREEFYTKNILQYSNNFLYDDRGQLIYTKRLDSNEDERYVESYFYNKDGSLRKIERSTVEGYYIHWFYKDGYILESWLIEGDKSTRSIYNINGTFSKISIYINDQIYSNKVFNYNKDNLLLNTVEITGSKKTDSQYNLSGELTEQREFYDDILSKRTTYKYKNSYLISEVISGHGKKEEYIYQRDMDGNIKQTDYLVNNVINKKSIYLNNSSYTTEEYKSGVIYLKEYYEKGEKIKRDLFLNGELFKSEKLSE